MRLSLDLSLFRLHPALPDPGDAITSSSWSQGLTVWGVGGIQTFRLALTAENNREGLSVGAANPPGEGAGRNFLAEPMSEPILKRQEEKDERGH